MISTTTGSVPHKVRCRARPSALAKYQRIYKYCTQLVLFDHIPSWDIIFTIFIFLTCIKLKFTSTDSKGRINSTQRRHMIHWNCASKDNHVYIALTLFILVDATLRFKYKTRIWDELTMLYTALQLCPYFIQYVIQ